MNDAQMLTIALALVATMFGLLVSVLGWLGSRIYSKLDEMGETMHRIASDLHEKVNDLGQRVAVVETYQQSCAHRTRARS